ncbi:MAG TPA: hypothetical protein VFI96_06975, partial [Longimicrobiaceae bacterium]|nr:hypothetical protein [Longimicrobiaceae bacterium]
LVLRPSERSTASHLAALCRSPEFQAAFTSLAVGTSTSHQRVKPSDLLSMTIVVAPRPLVEEFGAIADPLLTLAANLREKNALLRRTRDLLLPKLISGQVRVEALEDVPCCA